MKYILIVFIRKKKYISKTSDIQRDKK